MVKAVETTLEIDLNALEHNYSHLKARLKPSTKFMAVVKAFAYGSDMAIIAKKLEALRVDYFAVAYVNEGVMLRNAGVKTPILVLHPQSVNFDELIERCLEPSIYSLRVLKQFLTVAKQHGQSDYPVHLKFNTGLNRLGFWERDVNFILQQIHNRQEIKIKSIFSHLAASEDAAEKEFSLKQISLFEKVGAELQEKLEYPFMKHMLNTSGIVNFSKAQYEMVRSGIGLYGYANDAAIDGQLKPVATLKTIISQIHKIEPHESVGYNRAFKADGYKMTATLPIGHADGIGRQYGMGKTSVLVNGQPALIIGNVCMDMMMVDVTGIDCKEGDEVIVFGGPLSAETFAKTANTISYEILTGISQRVKRTVKK
ncbi:MAG: alanine racemase [Croceitalea sp.]|nr:alanine racemase [Croceitalea sp.]NNM18347.1 alanine racemase [Croceitalea sp.]